MTWDKAMAYARTLRIDGYDAWRLPIVEGLTTLINYGKNDPASSFPGMPSDCFWSSSSCSGSSYFVWRVYFGLGSVGLNAKSDSGYARCVRRGP